MFTREEREEIYDIIQEKLGLPNNMRALIENMWDCVIFGDGSRDDYYCGARECGSQELSDAIHHEICQYI